MKTRRFVAVTIGATVLGGVLIAGCGNVQQVPDGTPIAVIPGVFQENHTLRWDQNLPAATRFVVLAQFGNGAVLDKNTGLVWEKSPAANVSTTWHNARGTCANRNVGGQKGWRLPSMPELASLVDLSVGSPGPTLPPGHPFLNFEPPPQSKIYWSASSSPDFPTDVWVVDFIDGAVATFTKANGGGRAWCVRGPTQESVY